MPKTVKAGSKAAWNAVRHQPAVHQALFNMAAEVRDAAEKWVQGKPHTREHPEPNFEVRREHTVARARYTVHPITPYATYWVSKDPAGFIACLNAARG